MQSKSVSALVRPRILSTVLLCAIAGLITAGALLAILRSEAASKVSRRTLTFAERVAYQRAIEEVYWRHRIWPKENLNAKPSLDTVMSRAQLEKKVTEYLRNSQALEDYRQRPITAEDLQAEMDRVATNTKQPEVLRELFEALGNDPFLVAECLARPVLSERLMTNFTEEQWEGRLALSEVGENSQTQEVTLAAANYALPKISQATTGCTPDTWTATSTTNVPFGRYDHTAVWTGSEMIVWGGYQSNQYTNTGKRYNPSTDSWVATSTNNAPNGRSSHTAVWTGIEMIVWGGQDINGVVNSGGRYNPTANSWTATSTTNAPTARESHTAVLAGSEMIVWGGLDGNNDLNTGGRYNPDNDSWTATSTTSAPSARADHTAVWTGIEMIVWGGTPGPLNTGGKYNPGSDSWTATSITNAADGRWLHTAVWVTSEMIVWGGFDGSSDLNTGGRYNPGTDSWTATTTTGAPTARLGHTAVWTESEMIVWGGVGGDPPTLFDTGGSYNPGSDSWTPTSTNNAPSPRGGHTAVWTGSEMIVWGGGVGAESLNTGGRYCAQAGVPTPTPTPTATASATATATPTATSTPTPTPTPCTGRCTPTPRPRPTPAPRP